MRINNPYRQVIKSWMVGIICGAIFLAGMLWNGAAAGQPQTCEEKLRQTVSMLDITRGSRDQVELSLAEMFTRYQDAIREIEDLKKRDVKPEGK